VNCRQVFLGEWFFLPFLSKGLYNISVFRTGSEYKYDFEEEL
jgi:hypothetical protein